MGALILDRSLIILAVSAVICAASLAYGDRTLRLASLSSTAAFAVLVASETAPGVVPPVAVTWCDGACAAFLTWLLCSNASRLWLAPVAGAQIVLAVLDWNAVVIDGRRLLLYFRGCNLIHGLLVLSLFAGLAMSLRTSRAKAPAPPPLAE